MRGGHLDAVEPSLGRKRGGARVASNDALDVGGPRSAWLRAKPRAGNRRRRERRWPRSACDLLAPSVEDLDEDPRPVRLHGRSDSAVPVDDLGQVPTERVRGQQAALVDRRRLEDDQPDTASRAGLVIGDEVVRRQVLVDESRLMRSRDDPVRDLDRPESKRAKKAREHARRPPAPPPSSDGSARPRGRARRERPRPRPRGLLRGCGSALAGRCSSFRCGRDRTRR